MKEKRKEKERNPVFLRHLFFCLGFVPLLFLEKMTRTLIWSLISHQFYILGFTV